MSQKPVKIPLIGIFWIKDDNNLIVDACPYDKGEDFVGNWINYSGHYPFWEQYATKNNISKDYVYYPRGRVIYNKRTNKFKIMASRKVIGNKCAVAMIAGKFNLTDYVLCADAHYEDAFQLLEE